ncbi:putative atpase [Anaeramoeba flamelloides]|uniref:Atpase n=1 Tax=Anaeramoeba flamelloides TaxID=1746091 RepID=A0AAV8AIZ8_9EUKA|nr:putative atpase [Anaeramoeba flamelloides]
MSTLFVNTGTGEDENSLNKVFLLIKTGLFIAIAGYITTFLKGKYNEIYDYVLNRIYTTITISSDTNLFRPMLKWLLQFEEISKTNNLRVMCESVQENEFYTNLLSQNIISSSKKELSDNLDSSSGNSNLDQVYFSIGEGTHKFHYKGTKITVDFSINQKEQSFFVFGQRNHNNNSPNKQELSFEVFGQKKDLFKDIILEVVELKKKMEKQNSAIYLMDQWAESWDRENSTTKPIKMEFVILKKGLAEHLIDDCKKFLQRQQVYERLGIPFRRGYLFYGYPGCGKTTTVRAIAGELGLPICIMSLSNKELNDDTLLTLLNKAPRPCIVLLEDVDSCFIQREASEKQDQNRVSFSGLLNALDGVGVQEGRLFFLTTNHIERLSPALIRPGRVDKKIEFQKADQDQVERLFLKFFEGFPKLAKQFAEKVPMDRMSMALIQQHFLNYFDEPEKCLETIDELIKECQNTEEFEKSEKEKFEKKQKEIAEKNRLEKEKKEKEEKEKLEKEKKDKLEREKLAKEKLEEKENEMEKLQEKEKEKEKEKDTEKEIEKEKEKVWNKFRQQNNNTIVDKDQIENKQITKKAFVTENINSSTDVVSENIKKNND